MSDPLYGILELSKVLKKKGLGLCSILIQIWQFQFWLENNCSNIEGKKNICIYWQPVVRPTWKAWNQLDYILLNFLDAAF